MSDMALHDGTPKHLPTYSSRVSWYHLPWHIIISYIVVSESVSENQAYESSSWSILSKWFYTEQKIRLIDFAF